MRERADDETIGVSCGHRVPRAPLPRPDGKYGSVYWCAACERYRMAGNRATGERGFDFLLELRDDIARAGVIVELDAEPLPHQRGVMEALGAHVVVRGRAR